MLRSDFKARGDGRSPLELQPRENECVGLHRFPEIDYHFFQACAKLRLERISHVCPPLGAILFVIFVSSLNNSSIREACSSLCSKMFVSVTVHCWIWSIRFSKNTISPLTFPNWVQFQLWSSFVMFSFITTLKARHAMAESFELERQTARTGHGCKLRSQIWPWLQTSS